MKTSNAKLPAPRIAVCVSGLGLGNSTRLHAVLESLGKLSDDNFQITLFTWGNGLLYFHQLMDSINIVPLKPYLKPDEGLYSLGFCGHRIFTNFFRFSMIYVSNTIKIHRALANGKFKAALLDGDFHFLPFLFRSIPIFAISQSPYICSQWVKFRLQAGVRMWTKMVLFEFSEYLIFSIFSAGIFVPCMTQYTARRKQIIPSPLIVRRVFTEATYGPPKWRVGAVASGSPFYSQELESSKSTAGAFSLNLLTGKGKYSLDRENKPIIDSAQLILTQCGLSTLSECISRRKKMLLLPVARHPEQFVNASIIARLGLGAVFDIKTNLDQDLGTFTKLSASDNQQHWPDCSGAEFVAKRLFAHCALP